MEGASLLETVKMAKPTIILGLSGQGGVFDEDVLRTMGELNEEPVIFAMSNPSDHAECTAQEAFIATNGRAIFASGSPFTDYTLESGKLCKANQGNNMYIFPGIGLGVTVAGCKVISQSMILIAAEALASSMSAQELSSGMVYPDIENIREVLYCGRLCCLLCFLFSLLGAIVLILIHMLAMYRSHLTLPRLLSSRV